MRTREFNHHVERGEQMDTDDADERGSCYMVKSLHRYKARRIVLLRADASEDTEVRRSGGVLDKAEAISETAVMSEKIFRHKHRVTYADCTVGDHIYYSRYLELLEAARGEFFRQVGTTFLEWQRQDVIFPVIECRLRYKSPARYDDVLDIEVWVTAAERIRLNFGYRVLNQGGTMILEADTSHVCTGLDEKPKRLPEGLIEGLKPYFRG